MEGKISTRNIRNQALLKVNKGKLQIRLKLREFPLGKIHEEIHVSKTTVRGVVKLCFTKPRNINKLVQKQKMNGKHFILCSLCRVFHKRGGGRRAVLGVWDFI